MVSSESGRVIHQETLHSEEEKELSVSAAQFGIGDPHQILRSLLTKAPRQLSRSVWNSLILKTGYRCRGIQTSCKIDSGELKYCGSRMVVKMGVAMAGCW
ncbi:hypothetical protein PIB30_105828 [Stylosanthes scabra]|uniref:Uncharacterized protein n=1 Tax=Stylosanthes scabra TaxID=79078 RepID=A0ABU6U1Q1_9FABA|nr:hypothetical protein [Stylosanthes scabra]